MTFGNCMFPSTHWTLLAQATMTGDPAGREALARLCEDYRPPVVAFLRTRGLPPTEADDLAQDLFARLLTSRAWKRADPDKGKFRTFLLGILHNIINTHRTKANAAKNGGGVPVLSLDALNDEFGWEPPTDEPEHSLEFDRTWAVQTLRAAFERVRQRWDEAGRGREFAVYSQFLPGSQAITKPPEAAAELGVAEGTARTAICRLRDEMGEALRQQIRLTVTSATAVEEEFDYLKRVLASPGLDLGASR